MTALPANAGTAYPDEWLDEGVAMTRALPATTLDAFVQGSCELLTIIPDAGRYYLKNPLENGFTPFKKLSEAMDAGDRIANAIIDERAESMARDGGLDPELWKFNFQDRFVWFESAESADTRIERYGATRWVAVKDGQKAGVASSPAKAVEMYLQETALRP